MLRYESLENLYDVLVLCAFVFAHFAVIHVSLLSLHFKIWKHNLGMVELELSVAGDMKLFTVSAIHANLILKFGERGMPC
jgi:hypothetical protein